LGLGVRAFFNIEKKETKEFIHSDSDMKKKEAMVQSSHSIVQVILKASA